jgi:organic hydroperoxide reductase OsmC/OhrA
MHPFPHHYTVSSHTGPDGDVILQSEGIPPLVTVTPPEFDGPGGQWSPETLLVAAVADCYLLTFRGIARASRMPWSGLAVECRGTLERPDRYSLFTRFDIRASLTVPPEVNEDQARRILTRAEETCLITRSLTAQTHLEITLHRDLKTADASAPART